MDTTNLDTNIAKDKAVLAELQTLRYKQLCNKPKLTKRERIEHAELFRALLHANPPPDKTTDELWDEVMRDPFH